MIRLVRIEGERGVAEEKERECGGSVQQRKSKEAPEQIKAAAKAKSK